MAKKKTYKKKGDFSNFDSGYYEPFAGYHNTKVDQETYWNMVKTSKGVIPKQFIEIDLPMADDVGKKGQNIPKVGFKK